MKGIPHFKKDGAIYKGATHKDAKGKLMSGKNHTKTSVYVCLLYTSPSPRDS